MKFAEIEDTNSSEFKKRIDSIIHCLLWKQEIVILKDIMEYKSYLKIIVETRFGEKYKLISPDDLAFTFGTKNPSDIKQGEKYIVICKGLYLKLRRLKNG